MSTHKQQKGATGVREKPWVRMVIEVIGDRSLPWVLLAIALAAICMTAYENINTAAYVDRPALETGCTYGE